LLVFGMWTKEDGTNQLDVVKMHYSKWGWYFGIRNFASKLEIVDTMRFFGCDTFKLWMISYYLRKRFILLLW